MDLQKLMFGLDLFDFLPTRFLFSSSVFAHSGKWKNLEDVLHWKSSRILDLTCLVAMIRFGSLMFLIKFITWWGRSLSKQFFIDSLVQLHNLLLDESFDILQQRFFRVFKVSSSFSNFVEFFSFPLDILWDCPDDFQAQVEFVSWHRLRLQ